MCGIAGLFLHEPLASSPATVGEMLRYLAHRGPDGDGMWSSDDHRVILGHKRLAIIDPSPAGCQPMRHEPSGTCIVLNGEIYNFRELRRELELKGFHFRTQTDTEVLLAGYLNWGERVVDRLVGMFAFAVWDPARDSLLLARDRLGEKPLYYAAQPWGFAFASEVGALSRVAGLGDGVDRDAVALYLTYQYIPAPYSIFKEIRKLAPGHVMRVKRGGISIARYWDPLRFATATPVAISEPEAVDTAENLLREAVRGQLISDVPLGAFLSGGIDSSLVVSMMVELSATPVRTFTIGFESERHNEAAHALVVAERLGTNHTTEYFTDRDVLELVPSLPTMYGEPFGDSSALPTHMVARLARRHVAVSLSGDGGDELFGGYSRYSWLEKAVVLNRLGIAHVAARLGPVPDFFPLKVRRAASLLSESPRESYRRIVALFSAADFEAMAGTATPSPEFDRAWILPGKLSVRRRAMLCDSITYLPDAILTKVDRAAMATSLETRAPLLDHRIVEFSLSLPDALVRGKRVLKQLAYRRVGRSLLDRPKRGFGLPLAQWLRGPLKHEVIASLSANRLQDLGLGGQDHIERLVAEHIAATHDHAARLWSLFVLSEWMDHHNKQQSAARTPPSLGLLA